MDIDGELLADLRYRAKAELRKRARALRSAMPRDAILDRSRKIQRAIEALPALVAARRIALFCPIEGRNEVDLTDLDPVLRARGVRVAYPAVDPESREMTFRYAALESLQEHGLGFREPDPAAEEASELDAIVVPALQIDPQGHRIGYGAGYYDRALPRFCPPALAVGVAFDFQLIPEVPATREDFALRWVVTDARVLLAGDA